MRDLEPRPTAARCDFAPRQGAVVDRDALVQKVAAILHADIVTIRSGPDAKSAESERAVHRLHRLIKKIKAL